MGVQESCGHSKELPALGTQRTQSTEMGKAKSALEHSGIRWTPFAKVGSEVKHAAVSLHGMRDEMPSVVEHFFNPGIWEVEAGASL